MSSSKCFSSASTLETIPFPEIQISLFFLYSLTSLLTLIGNSIVIIVQLYGIESAQNIRKILLNLAFADIITGIFSVPTTFTNIVLGHWPFPNWLCPTAQYVQLLSVFVISFSLSIIGIERYFL